MLPFMIIGCCSPAWFIRFVFLTFVESTDSYSHHSCGLPSVVLADIVVLALITFVVVSCLLACLLPSSCSVSSTLRSPSLLLLRAGLDHPGGTHMARPLRWLHILFLATLLFVHFACSWWPSRALRGLSRAQIILTENNAGENAHCF